MFPRSGGFKSLLKIPPAPSLTRRILPRRKGLLSQLGLKPSAKLFSPMRETPLVPPRKPE